MQIINISSIQRCCNTIHIQSSIRPWGKCWGQEKMKKKEKGKERKKRDEKSRAWAKTEEKQQSTFVLLCHWFN
jgi:hypothetical protein